MEADMSQFGNDRMEAEADREWSDAETKELGDMLLRGLSIEEIARRLRGITARSETTWLKWAGPAVRLTAPPSLPARKALEARVRSPLIVSGGRNTTFPCAA